MQTGTSISAASEATAGHVFLKPETKIEPLAHGWYAWAHLLPPAQRAMNVAFRQVPLLRSFIKNPAVHVAASRDRSLFGGPVMSLSMEDVAEVKALLEEISTDCADLIQFAADLKQLDVQLQLNAKGHALDDVYASLPESLRGLVEVLYDLNHQPRVRLYEELVYDQFFAQSAHEISLSNIRDTERSFFMSTPRLKSKRQFSLKIPLADRRLDTLASMRTTAGSLPAIAESLGLTTSQVAAFRDFFTTAAPRRRAPNYTGSGVRVRYFGHACVLIETSSTAVLCDPVFGWDMEPDDGRFTFADLPDRIDYLVISHGHQDHCAPEMLVQLRHRVDCVVVPANNGGSIADPSLKLLFEHLGFRNIKVVSAFDEVAVPDGKITSLPFPGEHVDLDIHTRHGISVELKGRRFAFMVDSNGQDQKLFQRIARRTGRRVDALFLGMECHGAPLTWLYGPLLTKAISRRDDESRRLSALDSARACRVLAEFDPARVFVYAMGQEPWLRYLMGLEYSPESVQLKEVAAFLKHCEERAIQAENLYISREVEF
jgi:L-ascorbate metabolism protein UlaG (beta-lactamase superfamily)